MRNVTKAAARVRIDRLLVERGLVESREQAARLILAGEVLVDGKRVDKAGALVGGGGGGRLQGGGPLRGPGGGKLRPAPHPLPKEVGRPVLPRRGGSTRR